MEHSSAVVENSEDYLKVCILILNEVLGKKPIFHSYLNFCNLVGRNIMIYSDFEFWYYQLHRFCRGYFYDYNRSADPVPVTIMDMPMEMIQEITRNLDPVELTHLRAMNESFENMVDSIVMHFDKMLIDLLDSYIDHLKNFTLILNEVLGKKPIFQSYLNFCKLVGENTMNYPDFEFLYYRLSRGELDDSDWSINPVRKTIMDLPVSLVYKITENLDTAERTYLRSMNKCLKDIADIRPPNFEVIDISADDKRLKWKLNNKSFSCGLNDYGSCTLKILDSTIIRNECYFKKGMEYLSPVLKMPNLKVNHLTLNIMNGCEHLNNLLPVPFHAKRVSIDSFNIKKSLGLLSAMNSGELESIDFTFYGDTTTDGDVLEFFETEQFKLAKRVESNICLYEDDLMSFRHLKSFKFPLGYDEPVDFQIIRNIISTMEIFESCELDGDGFDIRTVAESLEAEIPFGPLKTVTHRHRIPESNEYLEFKIEEEESNCLIKIAKVC